MESDLRSIGETARASGLGVSARRFYDRARVLVPAMVDPDTGYRWYSGSQIVQARLIAGLRRVGMPVADIVAVLNADPAHAHRLLERHLRRLEDGLADARLELSRIRTLLDTQENPMTTVTLSRHVLGAALESVRFAVGTDPELPMLAGVLVDVDPGGVTFVATDRYRLAVHHEPVTVDGLATRLIAPISWVDRIRGHDGRDEPTVLRLDSALISAAGTGWTVTDTPLAYDYPDYRRILRTRRGDGTGAMRRAPVDAAGLRAVVGGAPRVVHPGAEVDQELTVLSFGADGRIDVVGDAQWRAGGSTHIAVNREFLLQALNAGGDGQLVLELDGPIHPLVIRRPTDDRALSLLMPVKP